jgi:predicted nucleotidyltransferase
MVFCANSDKIKPMDRQQLLTRIKDILICTFGSRLKGIVLYGSEARGNAESESDIDLLVLLSAPLDYHRDSWMCIDSLYPLVLELERPIHALPVDERDYQNETFPLFQHAKLEGILV